MERYETARIDVTQIEEDVIAASVEDCEEWREGAHSANPIEGWYVYYTDGTEEYIEGADKPDICP